MRVIELANELGVGYKQITATLRSLGVKDRKHHLQELSPEQADRVRRVLSQAPAARSPTAGDPPRVQRTATSKPPADPVRTARPPPGPVVAFGSLKGGVGKTTLALCAAELLRTSSRLVRPDTTWPVVIVDADVAGTEVCWVWNEQCGDDPKERKPLYRVISSLVDQLDARPDDKSELPKLIKAAEELFADKTTKRGIVVPTFRSGTEMLLTSLEWKDVLELTGTYVTQSLERVIQAIRDTGCAVVVDLPAFDVGFAHRAAEAIDRVKGTRFLVTDCDIRSLRATEQYLAAKLPLPEDRATMWQHVVVNRATDRGWRDQFSTRLAEVASWGNSSPATITAGINPRPIVAELEPQITDATGWRGTPKALMDAVQSYIGRKAPFLDEDDRRRLRGEPEKRK